MVPATMWRKAMVAVLCAVVATPIALSARPQTARADTTDAVATTTADSGSAPTDGSGAEAISSDSLPTDGSTEPTWFDDAYAEDWTWSDWFTDEPISPPATTEATSADPSSADPSTAAAAPAADATAPASDAAPAADALTSTVTATATTTTTTSSLTTDTLAAPTMSVSGQTVSWTPTQGVTSYVFARKIPGQATQYSIVSGTSITPPAVPGATVGYGVRTNVSGSAWAQEVSIAYPTVQTDTLAAPTMSVSGQTVSWTPTQGVTSYVFARKIPGQATQYSIVSGTSITPPAVPGATVGYGVRTNVSGSAWAQEVSIAYPASSPSPTPTPTPVDGTFQMGVVAGTALSYELSFIHSLGAHTARLEFGIGTSAANMASTIDAYARAGIRPLLLASFYGRTPTTAEAQNLASWAAAYGPGGSFWAGKTYPAGTAVTDIEFGNETSYSYQFSDNSTSTYAARAQAYALAAKTAAAAIAAVNPRVGLLVQGDNAQQGTAWVTNMFAAVPDLGNRVAGWTIHPYGPNWATRIDSTINSTASVGSPANPIWVTEWGLSSDDGRCLDDNYGFNPCMTYAEAASTLHTALSGMQSRYGARLGAFFLYQAHDQYATGTQTGREAYFGALQSSGAAKGAYTTEVEGDLAAN